MYHYHGKLQNWTDRLIGNKIQCDRRIKVNGTKLCETKSLCITTLVFICWGGPLEPSNALLSSILSKRCPSVLASIFIPLSLVVTASNEPSLLNLKRGLACKISVKQCQAKSSSMVTEKNSATVGRRPLGIAMRRCSGIQTQAGKGRPPNTLL